MTTRAAALTLAAVCCAAFAHIDPWATLGLIIGAGLGALLRGVLLS